MGGGQVNARKALKNRAFVGPVPAYIDPTLYSLWGKKRAFPRPILPKGRKTLVAESVGIDEIYCFVDFVGRGYGIWFWRISVIVVGALPPG